MLHREHDYTHHAPWQDPSSVWTYGEKHTHIRVHTHTHHWLSKCLHESTAEDKEQSTHQVKKVCISANVKEKKNSIKIIMVWMNEAGQREI